METERRRKSKDREDGCGEDRKRVRVRETGRKRYKERAREREGGRLMRIKGSVSSLSSKGEELLVYACGECGCVADV